jgi:hypothetical protein
MFFRQPIPQRTVVTSRSFLVDLVEILDLRAIYSFYEEKDGRGQAAYAPPLKNNLGSRFSQHALLLGGSGINIREAKLPQNRNLRVADF